MLTVKMLKQIIHFNNTNEWFVYTFRQAKLLLSGLVLCERAFVEYSNGARSFCFTTFHNNLCYGLIWLVYFYVKSRSLRHIVDDYINLDGTLR